MNWSGRRRGIERSDICDKGYDENVEINCAIDICIFGPMIWI